MKKKEYNLMPTFNKQKAIIVYFFKKKKSFRKIRIHILCVYLNANCLELEKIIRRRSTNTNFLLKSVSFPVSLNIYIYIYIYMCVQFIFE